MTPRNHYFVWIYQYGLKIYNLKIFPKYWVDQGISWNASD
jgi:hypothetical protein